MTQAILKQESKEIKSIIAEWHRRKH